jgi:methylamine dehydrogenase heavy chain
VVEFNDTSTLSASAEVVLPGKRAMVPPGTTSLGWSSDGRFLYVPFLTPAASLGVVDPRAHRFIGEIDTAGCALVIAHGPNLVSSLCDNGRMLTITLDEQGRESARALSEPFFDPEADPVFVQGVASPAGMLFVSFLGQVHEVDLPAGQPVLHAPWSLVTPAERGHWRTGGTQVAALHAATHRLYVPMHRGGEGTHKDGGTEIWVFDTTSHQRIARWPVAPLKLAAVTGVQVSQDAKPLLYAAMSDGGVAVLDAKGGKLLRVARNMGQTPWQLIAP